MNVHRPDDACLPSWPLAPLTRRLPEGPAPWVFVSALWLGIGFGAMLLGLVGCRVPSPSEAPERARQGLAQVGAAYSALTVLYEGAVEIQVARCKKQGRTGSEAERIACLGALGSQGSITLRMLEVRDLYDQGADVLEDLATLIAELVAELERSKEDG